jgi:hypothetical protein
MSFHILLRMEMRLIPRGAAEYGEDQPMSREMTQVQFVLKLQRDFFHAYKTERQTFETQVVSASGMLKSQGQNRGAADQRNLVIVQ